MFKCLTKNLDEACFEKTQALVPALSMFYLTISTYAPFGKSGRAPFALRFPTGLPSALKIMFPGLPRLAFSILRMMVVPPSIEILISNVTCLLP